MHYENESNEIDVEVPSGFISNIIMKEISIMQNKQFNSWKKAIGKMQ